MRTTIRLDADLLAAAKRHALQTGSTLTGVIEDALRRALSRPPAGAPRAATELPVASGGGVLQRGVDLDDSAALLELMEQSDEAR